MMDGKTPAKSEKSLTDNTNDILKDADSLGQQQDQLSQE